MRVLVVGAGISGRAAARLGRRRGLDVVVYDQNPAAVASLKSEGFEVATGDWSADHAVGAEVVVLSPGVSEHSPPAQDCLAAGLATWSELEFASRYTTSPIVAVTGTNGKTTTTLLISEMLIRSGRKAEAVGNIGTALADVVDEPWDVLVVEASSFQLRFISDFCPNVAVVLNAAEDHLDWHGSVEAYRRAKARICERQSSEDVLVYNIDDPGATEIAARAPGLTVAVSGTGAAAGAGVADGKLKVGGVAVPVTSLSVSDPAYLVDLAAAAVAAEAAGATASGITDALLAFRTGDHRRSVVTKRHEVAWVDDSKATNPHAAVASVQAYPSVVLVAGGRNKGLDLAPLVDHPHLRAVVALGEAQDYLVAASRVPAHRAATMEEAVEIAGGLARPGDTVLLAPGCASFDMFSSYAARGDAFASSARLLEDS